MQFTLRQFLLFFVCLSAWFSALASGHYLFGSYGVSVFGLLGGVALVLLFRLVLRWRSRSWTDRVMLLIAIVAAVSGVICLTNVAYHHGRHIPQERSRKAARLQAEVNADARFEHVVVTYEHSMSPEGECLRVQGVVESQESLDGLHCFVRDKVTGQIEWQVGISPRH